MWERQLGKGPLAGAALALPQPYVPKTTGTRVRGNRSCPTRLSQGRIGPKFPVPHSLPAGSLCGHCERHQSQDKGETETRKEKQRKSSEGP